MGNLQYLERQEVVGIVSGLELNIAFIESQFSKFTLLLAVMKIPYFDLFPAISSKSLSPFGVERRGLVFRLELGAARAKR